MVESDSKVQGQFHPISNPMKTAVVSGKCSKIWWSYFRFFNLEGVGASFTLTGDIVQLKVFGRAM